MFFNTHYDDNGIVSAEKNSEESIVDVSSYVPAKKRIETLILAGERLDDFRRSNYDLYDDDKDDGYSLDPLREVDEDLDVHDRYNETVERMTKKAEAENVRKHDESAKTKKADEDGSEVPADAKEE